jgi:hypothetical protein
MSAIETCRTAAIGGHIEGCEDCGYRRIAYDSCRNRHCPKCQGAAAREWLAAREADLLPVGYFHVVFTVPAEIADIAFHNKAVVYDLLFRVAAQTMLTIAADPRHLGARIGLTAVLHTWGSAMTHHPHIHMIVPGGGISLDGERWVSSRARFLLSVRVLASLFRRRLLEHLQQLHASGRLQFFGDQVGLSDRHAFLRHLVPLRKKRWFVYAKPPFSGPEAVLAYLSRYTHRVAISNHRLIALDKAGVAFRYKDYRRDGADRQRTMTLSPDEFIRRFLLHVLPKGFHRIRHCPRKTADFSRSLKSYHPKYHPNFSCSDRAFSNSTWGGMLAPDQRARGAAMRNTLIALAVGLATACWISSTAHAQTGPSFPCPSYLFQT